MLVDGCVEIEYDEALAAGSALLQTGDDIAAAGRAGLLLGCRSYGGDVLQGAAQRFADRFTHLMVQGLAEDAVAAGENLRATVRAYQDGDSLVPVLLAQSSGLVCV